MSEYTLSAMPVLGGYAQSLGDTRLEEVTGLGIVSVAVPLGGQDAMTGVVQDICGTAFPAPGQSALSRDGRTRFLGLARDQAFALLEEPEGDPAKAIETTLAGTAYVTLQSDNWVVLRLSGSLALAALERICPIELHPDAFPDGSVARTVMEHMGTIVLREAQHTFLLLSASSSAASFVHAVETSVRNVG